MTDGIGLTEAVATLRGELMAARTQSAQDDILLPVQSLTIELKVVATKTADGKAGFRVPFVGELGASGGLKREETQTVTVVFASPVDRAGNPVPVGDESDSVDG